MAERASFLVVVDLDPVMGWGNDADDWRRLLEHYLSTSVPHYNPEVVEFTPADLEPMKRAEREAGYPNCATCDGGGCPDCTDPA